MKTYLYVIDENNAGMLTWVSARNAIDAVAVYLEARGPSHPEDFDGTDELTVDMVEEKEGRRLTFADDDGAKCPMWDEWQRDTSRRVVACSET